MSTKDSDSTKKLTRASSRPSTARKGGTTRPRPTRSGAGRPRASGAVRSTRGGQQRRPTARTKHPRTPESKYVLRLRLRALGTALCVVAATICTWLAIGTRFGQAVDTLVMESAMRWSALLSDLGSVVTDLVSVTSLVVVAVFVVAVAVLRRRPTLAGRALGMVVGANVTVQLLKALVSRPDLGVLTLTVNSLPSGHVAVAVSLCLALVVVAPEWLRGPSAWLCWLWTSAMGIAVMVEGWHRLADVVVAVLITGAWALLLTPLENRQRHGVIMQRVMTGLVIVSAVVAVITLTAGITGVDIVNAAVPGQGFGYRGFVAAHATRASFLAACGLFTILAVVGAVINAVDRLANE